MDTGVKTALIAAVASVVSAGIAATAAILASRDSSTAKAEVAKLNRYVYNGSTIVSSSFAGDKMIVLLNGTLGRGPSWVLIDMDRLTLLCGDIDGCTLTLGATRFREQVANVAIEGKVIEAPLMGSPCRFSYDKENKYWSLSQSCVANYGLFAAKEVPVTKEIPTGRIWEFNRPYQIYEYSSAFGKDDDNSTHIIMGFKGACYLAEAAPDISKGKGEFQPDDPNDRTTGRGLYLVASSPSWEYPGAYPKDDSGGSRIWPADDPARQCVLIIDN